MPQESLNMKTTLKIIISVVVVVIVGVFIFSDKKTNTPADFSIQGTYEKKFALIVVTELGQNKIKIEGSATWEGPNAAIDGDVYVGEIEGTVTLTGVTGIYEDNGCEVELIFSKDKLKAKDNNQCGGLNVSFTGEYIKTH